MSSSVKLTPIEKTMAKSYLEYSMSVITNFDNRLSNLEYLDYVSSALPYHLLDKHWSYLDAEQHVTSVF